jgi:cytoskeletal protein CcmA (bactofilin family)
MWGKTEDQPPATPAVRTTPTPPAAPVVRTASSERATIIGKTMRVVGEVSSDEELLIDGELEGILELRNRLTIGPTGKVHANIKAKEVVIFGSVRGNVEAEHRISLRTGASIIGDIKTAGIVIEDGAYFKGGIDISRTEVNKQEPNKIPNKGEQKPQHASAAAKG